MLHPGLYEKVINRELAGELDRIEAARKETGAIDKAEAAKVLAQYLSKIVEKGLDRVLEDGGGIGRQIGLANEIIRLIGKETEEEDFDDWNVDERAEQLLAVLKEKSQLLALGKAAKDAVRPETSIAQSSLFTGAMNEPQMFSELKKEIVSADRIDFLVSFIKWSGLRLIWDELRAFTESGGRLRVITTSYMGATDVKAVEELRKLPNTTIKISYDTKRTRLHAKTYVFYRETGFTTAYVGSSNLSNAAISSGMEWNLKVTAQDLPETVEKIAATFDGYWNDKEFETYEESDRERLSRALKEEKKGAGSRGPIYLMDIRPYAFQQEILDKLEAERTVRGHRKNLVVAATGTGKTVISAFDYRNFCEKEKRRPRLLFIAHREEILEQSLATFRAVLKDANFGDLFVGDHKPEQIDHLFMSIQTFNSKDFTAKTEKNFYDYIIVDEFHHAAAKSYRKLLAYYEPKLLLGLTATPERMDGKNILDYFDDRIAAEIRLPEAIDRKLLCPFQYFGVSDIVDLTSLKWSKGGYDKSELSNVYTMERYAAGKRADMIIESLLKYVTDIDAVKGLGFCVSVAHAAFMAEHFNQCGIKSLCLSGKTPDEERAAARKKLATGEVRFIFVVDLYNEGVDIPEINTVLFLRPTESLTVFLQQLGRGLRLSKGKDCLTVLDFIGRANKKYNFEEKFAALLSRTRYSVKEEVRRGFISVPKGCYIQLERKAKEYILENIKASYGTAAALVSRMETFEEDTGKALTLANFLTHYRLDPRALYKFAAFSRLAVRAGKKEDFEEPLEDTMRKALLRLASADSRRWIDFLLALLQDLEGTDPAALPLEKKRMLNMFYVTVWGKVAEDWGSEAVREDLAALAKSPVMREELTEFLRLRKETIDFIDEKVDIGCESPLDLHCTYTRDQILAALDFAKPATVQEGVKWLPEKQLDLFFVTLNKSDKDYSPTTMYKDYSVSETLFHWQSQSSTSEHSPTGQRYIHHRQNGSRVLLFVREWKKEKISGGAEAYTFLGTANYVMHEGSKPMSITWKLDRPIPAKFMKKTNKMMIG